MGRRTMVEKIIVPQEVEAQQSPEVKAQQVQYTPMHALAQRLGFFTLGYYRGAPAFIDLEKAVVFPLRFAEWKSVVGRVDSRQKAEVTIASGSSSGTEETKKISAPDGQVFYLKGMTIVVPVETEANIEVLGANYEATYIAPGTRDIDFEADLGTEIRVPDLTCKLKATTTTTADRKATFTPKGRKAEKFY